jgi:stage II sporulation protein AA (anti-sigma F factor antagonist)
MDLELDLHAAESFRRQIDAWVDESGSRALVLNLRRVTFIDSTGLGALLGRFRRMRAAGGTLSIVRPASPVRTLFDAAGLGELLPVFPTEERALG